MFSRHKKDHLSELVGYAGFFMGSEIKAEGSIQTEDDVFIDGVFKGEVVTTGVAEIGKSAKFRGSVQARSVIIEGESHATVEAVEEITVASCAEITGKLTCLRIKLDPGAAIAATIKSGGES